MDSLDLLGCILEWFESGDEYVCEEKQTIASWIVLIKTPEHFGGGQLAQMCSSGSDGLVSLKCLFAHKVQLVHEQTVDDGDVFVVPETVDQGSDDGNIYPGGPQLLQAVGIINAVDELAADAMDGCVDG